jgi:methionyl-tRNA synthetase
MPDINPFLLILIVAWVLYFKGIALWKSARLEHKKWFIALLVINTFGILEIYYIYKVAKKYKVEVEEVK